MEKVIDALVEKMTADEVWGCLEDGNPADNFYALWGIEYRLYDFMSNYEPYIEKSLGKAFAEHQDTEKSAYEIEMDLRRANGWQS